MYNLGSNAVKYTAAGSVVITISAERIAPSHSHSSRHHHNYSSSANASGGASINGGSVYFDVESQQVRQRQQQQCSSRRLGQRWRRCVLLITLSILRITDVNVSTGATITMYCKQ
jgi:hypothetical protein